MTIGERVFFLLDKYGLQQKELADAINVSKGNRERLENPQGQSFSRSDLAYSEILPCIY